jgi:hypothetical protein
VAKKKQKKQEMPILWESFLIFMVFIFYKQERYGRRAAALPLPERKQRASVEPRRPPSGSVTSAI